MSEDTKVALLALVCGAAWGGWCGWTYGRDRLARRLRALMARDGLA